MPIDSFWTTAVLTLPSVGPPDVVDLDFGTTDYGGQYLGVWMDYTKDPDGGEAAFIQHAGIAIYHPIPTDPNKPVALVGEIVPNTGWCYDVIIFQNDELLADGILYTHRLIQEEPLSIGSYSGALGPGVITSSVGPSYYITDGKAIY